MEQKWQVKIPSLFRNHDISASITWSKIPSPPILKLTVSSLSIGELKAFPHATEQKGREVAWEGQKNEP